MFRCRSLLLLLVVALSFPVLALCFLVPVGGVAHMSDVAIPTFAAPQFEAVWSRTDLPVAHGDVARSWVWGPAIPGATHSEPFGGAPGGVRTVQYFDKARMEVNGGVSDPASKWATTTGLLVVEMVSGRVQIGPDSYENRDPARIPVAGDGSSSSNGGPLYSSFRDVASLPGGPERRVASAPGSEVTAGIDSTGAVYTAATSGTPESGTVHYSAYSQETGHNIPDVFTAFMGSSGLVSEGNVLKQGLVLDALYAVGYPITEAYWTTVPVNGKPTRVLVQLYQRRVLTYIPDFEPAWRVQMGNVGQHYLKWRNAQTTPTALPPPTAAPAAAPGATDAFLHVSGSQFYYRGQAVTLKGTNYWMHIYPPGAGTWTDWDGPIVQQELAQAHELGVNSVRVALPYDSPDGIEVVWGDGCTSVGSPGCDQVRGPIVDHLTQMLQIAAGYNMKVLVTLFDQSDKFPQPDTAEYNRQMTYLQALVRPFVDDDRVLGWDLHNEPENYNSWHTSGPGVVISWLDNMAGAVRSMDTRHPITVGVTSYQTLWQDFGGKRLLDVVDIASFHSYDAGTLSAQIKAVKEQTNKPVLLEEMGWPTGPASLSSPAAVYDEPTQQFLYRSMLKDARDNSISGVMQWTLQDNLLGTPKHYIKPNIQAWFGLVRLDNSFKPAAIDFRDSYPVPLLPSLTSTNLPLTPR